MGNLSLLGFTVRDLITGFTGIVTGQASYLSGCTQCLVVPKMKDDKLPEPQWYDHQRLRVVEGTDRIDLNNMDTPGSDKEAPKR